MAESKADNDSQGSRRYIQQSEGAVSIPAAVQAGEDMLSPEDMAALTAEEEKCPGVNSPEFMERHNEIMNLIEQSRYNKRKPLPEYQSGKGE